MGGLFSSPSAVESSSSEESRVLSFHSTASWKTHFDSCKESNELVIEHIWSYLPLMVSYLFMIDWLFDWNITNRWWSTSRPHGVGPAASWSRFSRIWLLSSPMWSSSRSMLMSWGYSLDLNPCSTNFDHLLILFFFILTNNMGWWGGHVCDCLCVGCGPGLGSGGYAHICAGQEREGSW